MIFLFANQNIYAHIIGIYDNANSFYKSERCYTIQKWFAICLLTSWENKYFCFFRFYAALCSVIINIIREKYSKVITVLRSSSVSMIAVQNIQLLKGDFLSTTTMWIRKKRICVVQTTLAFSVWKYTFFQYVTYIHSVSFVVLITYNRYTLCSIGKCVTTLLKYSEFEKPQPQVFRKQKFIWE